MFSPKRFAELTKRSKFVFPRLNSDRSSSAISRSLLKGHFDGRSLLKGHFVVYTMDGDRFVVPLEYLNSPLFKELLKMSEQEFGLPMDGPITLPCDSSFMDYIISFLKGNISTTMEKALLISISSGCCSSSCSYAQEKTCQKLPLYGC